MFRKKHPTDKIYGIWFILITIIMVIVDLYLLFYSILLDMEMLEQMPEIL